MSDTESVTIVHRAAGGRGDRYHSDPECRFIEGSPTTTYRLCVAKSWSGLSPCDAGDCDWSDADE